jgi:hypothetical protein
MTVVCLLAGLAPSFAQEGEEEEERGWQDILKDVVKDAVEESSSSQRLGRIRDVDVVNRSASMLELEVELKDVTEPGRTILTVEVLDDEYQAIPGFDASHETIPEGDGKVLVYLSYRGEGTVRSLGAKVYLVDAETNSVSSRRKAALPWEWTGDGSGSYHSAGGSMAGASNLSTRPGAQGGLEQRETQVVTLDPQRVGSTPKMETINMVFLGEQPTSQSSSSGAEQQPSGGASKPDKPPPEGTSSSSTNKPQPSVTGLHTSAIAAAAAGNVVLPTSLDLYAMAKQAKWKSARGTLPFHGSASDNRGFVRDLRRAKMINGKVYDKVLQTHPEWKDNGYISGTYTAVIPGGATRFEAKGGFLAKVNKSDGVWASVSLKEGARSYNLVRKKIVPADGVVSLRGNVPESLRGKRVNIVLHVGTGTKSIQDWFAWVAPIIR